MAVFQYLSLLDGCIAYFVIKKITLGLHLAHMENRMQIMCWFGNREHVFAVNF